MLDLMGHCRFHKYLQGAIKVPLSSPVDEGLGRGGVFPKADELFFPVSRAVLISHTVTALT